MKRKPKKLTLDTALKLAVESQTAAIKLAAACDRLELFILQSPGGEDFHFARLDARAAANGARAAELMLQRVIEELGK